MPYSKKKIKHDTYNDGFLSIGRISPIYDRSKKRIGEEFNQIDYLAYSNMSRRDNDYTFAQAFGYTLDMKVKVPFRQISTNNKVKIQNDIYDIYKKDEDYPNIYLYLQKVVLKDD